MPAPPQSGQIPTMRLLPGNCTLLLVEAAMAIL
jgi:hypothetical protein